MITPYNILRHELVGLEAGVVEGTHEGYRCRGKIVEETRNMLSIKHGNEVKKIPKDCVRLELKLPKNAVVRIDGNLLVERPEDRIKKKYRIKF